MDKPELKKWLDRYDKEEIQYDAELERNLGSKIRKVKSLTKEDLVAIVKWKFQGRLKGRQKHTLNLIKTIPEAEIQDISRNALNCDCDRARLILLMGIKGVKAALASTVLAFYDPINYCVFDIHVYDELFGKNSKTRPKNLFSVPDYYLETLDKVRVLAEKHDFKAREVEKALFKKNFEKQ